MSLTVCKMNSNNRNKYETLYEFIETSEEAILLSQLAMGEKRDDELIFIFAGWNRSIKTYHKDEYTKALLLAEKYKVDYIRN